MNGEHSHWCEMCGQAWTHGLPCESPGTREAFCPPHRQWAQWMRGAPGIERPAGALPMYPKGGGREVRS